MNNKSKRFPPEFRERAARMVLEEEKNRLSWWSAVMMIAPKLDSRLVQKKTSSQNPEQFSRAACPDGTPPVRRFHAHAEATGSRPVPRADQYRSIAIQRMIFPDLLKT